MGKTPKTYPHGAIVPSKCKPRKPKTRATNGIVPVPAPDTCCSGLPLPMKPGFPVCDANGNRVILNDYPATGGPWVPGVNPVTGGFVWVNTGG